MVQGRLREENDLPRRRPVQFSHLSIELGHPCREDLLSGPKRLRTLFSEAEPWIRSAAQSIQSSSTQSQVSTCLLIDDYFATLKSPRIVVPQVIEAAKSAGLGIDYLARESGIARTSIAHGWVSPAELLVGSLVVDPLAETAGRSPKANESGWFNNAERSVWSSSADASDIPRLSSPPTQVPVRKQAIFADIELWDRHRKGRVWSCPLLAAAWQLLRLGLLREYGNPLIEPNDLAEPLPTAWSDLSTVTRLNPRAAPFCAYHTLSILSAQFLPVEFAVQAILDRMRCEPEAADYVMASAHNEGMKLSPKILDRIGYVFTARGEARLD